MLKNSAYTYNIGVLEMKQPSRAFYVHKKKNIYNVTTNQIPTRRRIDIKCILYR